MAENEIVLTHDQMVNLTPEQIEQLENDPAKLEELLGKEKPVAAAPDAGAETETAAKEDEPIVLNKSGKGTIPYTDHVALRQQAAQAREQLVEAQAQKAELEQKLSEMAALQTAQLGAKSGAAQTVADGELHEFLERLKEDSPELYGVVNSLRTENAEVKLHMAEIIKERAGRAEQAKRDQLTQVEQAQQQADEDKENNPYLAHWEKSDKAAWQEAIAQDNLLRASPEWHDKPFEKRYEEVVRRVRSIVPNASLPKQPLTPETLAKQAEARLSQAPRREVTTLTDIPGGTPPETSALDKIESLTPLELMRQLSKMTPEQERAMAYDLD